MCTNTNISRLREAEKRLTTELEQLKSRHEVDRKQFSEHSEESASEITKLQQVNDALNKNLVECKQDLQESQSQKEELEKQQKKLRDELDQQHILNDSNNNELKIQLQDAFKDLEE